jgi:uncharacterized protein
MEILAADLGTKADRTTVENVLKTNTNVTVLVNNAGFGATAPLLQSDVDRLEDMVTLNVTTLMRLAHAAVPGFVARLRRNCRSPMQQRARDFVPGVPADRA